MTQKQTITPRTGSEHPSWGAALGLLAGCGITLIGVALNLPPDVILLRALLGGCIIGSVVSVVAASWRLVATSEED